MRIGYALSELQSVFEGGDPFISPSFHGSYIAASDGRSALLMSCEGYQFKPVGFFSIISSLRRAFNATATFSAMGVETLTPKPV